MTSLGLRMQPRADATVDRIKTAADRLALALLQVTPYFATNMIESALPTIRMADHGDDDRHNDDDDRSIGLATRTKARTRQPAPYRVLMLNDDYTPMEFVVLVLQRFFRMDMEAATRVMLAVHQRGVGVCGVYSYEVAETKVTQVMDFARQNQHPLQCTMEKA